MALGTARIIPPSARGNPSRGASLDVFARTISAGAHANPGQRTRSPFLHDRIRLQARANPTTHETNPGNGTEAMVGLGTPPLRHQGGGRAGVEGAAPLRGR